MKKLLLTVRKKWSDNMIKNNPNNIIANAILHVMSHVEEKEITYSDVYTKNFFRKKG